MAGSTTTGIFTFGQLETLWTEAGGPAAWAPVMAGVALAESGGYAGSSNVNDVNGGSYGLWQINGSHAGVIGAPPASGGPLPSAAWITQMGTPSANATEAVAVFNGGLAAGNPLGPWKGDPVAAAFQNLTTPPPLAVVLAVVAQKGVATAAQVADAATPPASVAGGGIFGGVPAVPANPSTGGAADAQGLTLPSFLGGISGLSKIVGDLASSAWWKRVGIFSLGGALFVIGLAGFIATSDAGQKVISEGAKAAAVA